MEEKVEQIQPTHGRLSDASQCSSSDCSQVLDTSSIAHRDVEELGSYALCRVCHCVESDKGADAALAYLNIVPPTLDSKLDECETNGKEYSGSLEKASFSNKNGTRDPGVIEFVGPDGKIFVCSADIEAGSCCEKDPLVDLGCSCKNELALAHYACALNKNVRPEDFKKIVTSLRDYESLRERTDNGIVDHFQSGADSGLDPDALAAVRRQRLSEISLWFNPQNNFRAVSEETVYHGGTGILIATGLLTVTLAWLIAPRVGKKTARNGLHILLGGMCALTVVIFLRFVVLSRIRYGPARYWAILFVFWFLVFGIWASRTHSTHTN
ncbi:unnamed protein product [Spirodela intermedia]|uniref:Uncharacterized protein n=1 Tax=Spirodela intermedia TaxID=51605 RepID=A0A7I8J1C1_SPIIN|nr:unnamed protein product [Spirodela intermedia]CAA6663849.1 unnamed protein product [Spirodela intermedia]